MLRDFFDAFLRRFVRRAKTEDDFRDEIDAHLAIEVARRVRDGESPDAARRAARREFGNRTLIAEETRDSWGLSWLDELLRDALFAWRVLRKSPTFTIVAIAILALGIGANSAIFTLVNAVLLRSLPVADPAGLVRFGDNNDCCVTGGDPRNGNYTLFSKQNYLDLKAGLPEFEEIAAIQAGFTYRPVVARAPGTTARAESVSGEFVSGNYFRTLGVNAFQGRMLSSADDAPGAPAVAVMSYESWQSDYSGDPRIPGSTFLINTRPVTIVGIAARGFFGDRIAFTPPRFYLPLSAMPLLTEAPYVEEPTERWLYIVGRLRPGITASMVQPKVNVLQRRFIQSIAAPGPRTAKLLEQTRVALTPGGAGISTMREFFALRLKILEWASALVLLIACANVSNLLLVRGASRTAELSLRAAIGARRGRIVRQLLAESGLLALTGGIAGVGVAYGGVRLLLAMAFPGTHLPIDARPSPEVLGFAVALSLATGILSGIAPAFLSSHADPAEALRGHGRTAGSASPWLQRCLVALQVALSLVLLVGAGLFGRSLSTMENSDFKVTTENRYIVHINPQAAGYRPSQVEQLYHVIEARFHAIPGLRAIGIASYTPMEDNNNGWGIQVGGRPETYTIASVIKANPDYFASVGTKIVAGRGIEPEDTSASEPVVVVNKAFVRKMFHEGENPLGHYLGFPGPASSFSYRIVGVVEDSVYTSLTFEDHTMIFIPVGQRPKNTRQPIEKDDSLFAGALVLQTAGAAPDMESLTRQTLAAINPNLAVVRFQSFSAQIAEQFSGDRLIARLALLFGILAMLLAAVGLYGVTAYSVVRRIPEIGLRIALGAGRGSLVALVVRRAMAQSIVGLALGIPAALYSVRFIRSQLYGIKDVDTGLLATSAAVLLVATLIAAAGPARRAASTEPMKALRAE